MPDKPNGDGRKDLEEEKAPEKSETGETAGEAGPKEPGQTDPETSTDDATPETDEPLDHTASKETEETNKETADSEKADNTESAEVQEDGVPKTAESEMPNEVLAVNPEDGLETQEGDIAGGVDGDITWRIDADGKLTVSGTGDVTNTDAWPWASYRENIVSAEVNVTGMTDASGMFSYCSNLNSLDLSNFDTSNVTHMRDMFSGCTGMTKIFTPCNVNVSTVLPLVLDEFWFLPDGTEITELPQNLDHSVVITRRRNPKIITTTPDLNMDDVIRVKYVPYSYTVETNNWDEDNKVTFSIEKGELAEGLQIYPETGEIYGVPLETGKFPITVKASYSNPEYFPSYADLTLTVIDNTDSNVLNASDAGYEVEQYIGSQVFDSAGSFSYVVTESNDQLFVSSGEYNEFIDFWLNGKKLVAGEDYTSESGSTRITIRKQTFEEKADQDGTNTIAAEFRVGGNPDNALKRTAQNFRMDIQGGSSNNEHGSGSGSGSRGRGGDSGGSSSGGGTESVSYATSVIRLVDASGNPLPDTALELHSTPQEARTDRNGIAVFAGVETGVHTLYAKDGNGTVFALKSFELLFGEHTGINGDQITVKAGAAFTLSVQVDGNELKFLSLRDGDLYQVVSAATGDNDVPLMWFLLSMLSAGAVSGSIRYRRRKQYAG